MGISRNDIENMKKRHTSDLYFIGLLLAFIGGYMDAFTYSLYDVFANAQTGNLVHFALHLSRWSSKCLQYGLQILVFFIGVFLTDTLICYLPESAHLKTFMIILSIEFVILLIVGFIPYGSSHLFTTSFVAFTAAIQFSAFRKMGGLPLTTTMCTGNLKSTADFLANLILYRNIEHFWNFLKYASVILAFMTGAVVSSIFCKKYQQKSIWFCDIVISIIMMVFILDYVIHKIRLKRAIKAYREGHSSCYDDHSGEEIEEL